jgi:NADPH-dependent curcumin reductase CurA
MMKQVVLAAYVKGNPKTSDFRVEEVPMPQPGAGEILVKVRYIALDPLIRFSLDETLLTGATKLALGDVIAGPAICEVIASNHKDYAVGDVIDARSGWREYAVLSPDHSDYRGPPKKIDTGDAPLSAALGALGGPGQTAHEGIIATMQVKAGETVVISAAAGAVGTVAGQIAKVLGARVVGIAGGKAKCDALVDLGFDAAVDYKAPDFAAQLAAALPNGADVYFDNVGGDVTMTVLPLLNRGARMAMCGFISYYGVGMEGPGPDKLPGFYRMIMAKGLTIKGFAGIMAGPKPLQDIAGWIAEGKIKPAETIIEGIDAAPAAFAGVFSDNAYLGKLLVKVSDSG